MPKIVDHEQQRSELSATVVSVIAELGLENTTLRTVAAHHGCTKGMVQHYFSDKEDLLLGAMASVEDACERRMSLAEDTLTELDLLQARLAAQLPLKPSLVREWQVRLAFNTRAAISRDMRKALVQRQEQQFKVGVACLRAGRRSGEVKAGINPGNSYRALIALVFGLGVGAVMDPKQWSATVQRQILRSAIDDLRP